ncbi:MAG: ATP-dependent helicase [Candidatus Dadabacteria bacterium]|nr:MAG: ATP-dependent helicase [Candidatus Dadabacteria bacterium]
MARKFALGNKRSAAADFERDLNPEQLAVATAPGGPMLVIAGAGTGKTRALTYRLAWLVDHGVDPEHILLVTFTNRAAREMLARVDALVRRDTRRLWGGTFHHVANRILREHGRAIGISPDFTILDREDAQDLMRACIAEAGIDLAKRRFPGKAVLVSISSFVENTLEPLETVLAKRFPMFEREAHGIATVLDLYRRRKRERQLLDYDDLLSRWLELLTERDEIRVALAERFQHILVDEYQDTNAIQGRIVDLLASVHRNLCVVGDDSQSIYSFRGASFTNIVEFKQRYPDATEYRLETNYRSTPEILALANASIARNRVRLPKELRAVRPSAVKPAVVACHDHYQQSQFIAEFILHLLDEGRRLGDIAVLYRSHWHALEIQLELRRRNIPFQVRGGLRFFEQAHIKDVLCWLRLVHNPRDEIAWLRVLPLLPRIGSRLARRLWSAVASAPDPLAAARDPATAELLPAAARTPFRRFARLLGELTEISSPAEMIERILEQFYADYLLTHYEGAALRQEDLRGLANFAAQYANLSDFLADVSLAGEFSGETVVTGPDEQEFVVLSTVHQAKGLEWPVVLIPWLADGRFPTDLAINTPEEEEEERRVFHVAVTRAKDELYLVYPQSYRNRSRGVVLMKPSRFLTELPPDLTEPLVLE